MCKLLRPLNCRLPVHITCTRVSPIYIIFTFIVLVISEEINSDPRITIPDGKLRGLWMRSTSGKLIEAYIGIPYAAPPVGKLRFQAPKDPVSWYDERDASTDLPPCVQLSDDSVPGKQIVEGQEDCLRINVYKPKHLEHPGLLPVLFFIHGGGFYKCSSTIRDYGPEILLNEDILLVTFNYRLDVLGFLTTEDEETSSNNGFKDQVAALKWVRKNIKYFGGDPEHITIYGHSAGGTSVQYHLFSPQSKGLFQKAISGSGTMHIKFPYPKGLMAERTRLFGDYFKCPTFDSAVLIKCLQNVPVESLFSALDKFKLWENEPSLIFGPVLEIESEEAFITSDSISNSNVSIPWMTGFTSEEGLIFTAGLSKKSDLLNQLESKFKKLAPMVFRYDHHKEEDLITSAVKQFYFKEEKISRQTIPQLTNVFTDALMLFGILKSLTIYKGPVYLYYFTHRGQYSGTDDFTRRPHKHKAKDEIDAYIKRGVSHGDELQYIFPYFKSFKYRNDTTFSEADETVSKQFVQLLTTFMVYWNPADLDWKPTSLENLQYMHMSSKKFTMKQNLLPDRVHFWSNWLSDPENQQNLREEL